MVYLLPLQTLFTLQRIFYTLLSENTQNVPPMNTILMKIESPHFLFIFMEPNQTNHKLFHTNLIFSVNCHQFYDLIIITFITGILWSKVVNRERLNWNLTRDSSLQWLLLLQTVFRVEFNFVAIETFSK